MGAVQNSNQLPYIHLKDSCYEEEMRLAITIKREVKGDKEQIFKKIKRLATKKDWKLVGDTSEGRFSGDVSLGFLSIGRVSGRYKVEGNLVTIRITKKPKLVSRDDIEDVLRKHLK